MIDSLRDRFDKAAEIAKRHNKVHLFSHYDADGICSTSVVASALRREGIDYDFTIFPTLGEEQMEVVRNTDFECMIMTDMGTSFLEELGSLGKDCIVLDHHEPLTDTDLAHVAYVNCHNAGIDGSHEVCASTMAYLFAQSMGDNRDLIEIAIGGMIGDKQHIGGFKGVNKGIVDEAVFDGRIIVKERSLIPPGDLRTQLYESIDPFIKGVSGDKEGIEALLESLGIDDEPDGERMEALESRLIQMLRVQGTSEPIIDECTSIRYYLPSFGMDAERMSTIADSCGRSGKELYGIGFCMDHGNPDAERACSEQMERTMVCARSVTPESVVTMGNLQYFTNGVHGITGTMASIQSKYLGIPTLPVIGFCIEGDMADISSRCTNLALSLGINMATVMKECSRSVGGNGGGHANAAGGRIPADRIDEFVHLADRMIFEQKML